MLALLYSDIGFVQQPCSQLKLLPVQFTRSSGSNSRRTPSANEAVPVCWERVSCASAEGKCTVLSIRTHPPCKDSSTAAADSAQAADLEVQLQQWIAPEWALAGAGCFVKLVTDTPSCLSQLGGNSRSHNNNGSSAVGSVDEGLLARISTATAVLGVSADPFAEPPVHTLQTLVESEVVGTAR